MLQIKMRECCGGPRQRSTSAPKILIPSEVMGEYEDPEFKEKQRRRSAPLPSRPPGLYPLTEEGTYGTPPIWSKPETYKRRERKPKVYASYAISSDCDVHAEKLESIEKSHSLGTLQNTRRSSAPPRTSRTSVSPAPRPSSALRRSVSSSPERPPSRLSFTTDTSGYSSNIQYQSTQYINSPAPSKTRKTGGLQGRGKCRKFLDFLEEDCEEGDETDLIELNSNSSLSSHTTRSSLLTDKMDWDSMGILGLTSRLYSETQAKQESFLCQPFTRKDSVSTHVC
ncbi:uncharacterized protein LOC111698754 isoform X2 [Eurytemora carolleeae]|uniref:uncharacterized protein LOC111698754 isoform X2 n=1 Tax=Eurytemora carolleeae TaxID=1294199 RepID=UPI000C788429|nr:uncharacterized protein LOC111698754 isoform X2 [Eurytemora carolleeae]|eukprot:XP_023324941.1 uncharacterized protein LOC111698754 isoform X2 [Eurytemora affinis]